MPEDVKIGPYGSGLTARQVRLGDVAEIRGGKRLPAGSALQVEPTSHPYLRVVDFRDGRVAREGILYVPADVFPRIRRYTISAGDVYMSIVGTVGLVGTVGDELDGASLTENAAKISPTTDMLDRDYLSYFLRSPDGQQAIREQTVGSTQPKLALYRIANIRIPLPPLPEQKRIAHILGTLDDKIELNRRMCQTLEEMARALFKSWFVDFDPVRAKAEGRQPFGMDAATAALFPDSFVDSELGMIPEGWEVKAIGDVVEVVGGSTPSTVVPAYWDGPHSFATPKDLSSLRTHVLLETERGITDEGLAQISSGLLPVGTVLLSSRAPIGYLAVTQVPVAVNQGFIAMKCSPGMPSSFVLLWARQNMETIIGSANGTTFLEISKRSFRPIPALLPRGTVFEAFASVVEPMFRLVAILECESRRLAQTRDQLLPAMVSGPWREVRAEVQGRELND